MTRPCAVLATGLLLAAAGAAGSEGPWTGTCEVKVVECPLMTFEAVREIGGGGNLPGTLSAAQVELLWKAVKEKKARVVLSAEVAATEGQRSEWRSGRTHRYLAEYNVEGDAVASTVGELALGWTVSVLPMPALGGGYVLKASVEHRDLADGKASVATPHGALETPVVEVRSVTSVAKTPARAVSVLGIVPAAGHGAGGGGGAAGPPVQVVLLRTDLPARKQKPPTVPRSAEPEQFRLDRRRVVRVPAMPRQSFVSVKVISVPDALLDEIRTEAGDSAAGAEITPGELARLAKAVKSGEARVVEAGAVSCVSFYGGELRAGSLTRYLSGYDLVRVKARGAGDPATVTLADPVAEEVFSGFSLRVSAGRWPAPLERSGNCVIAPGRPGAVRLVCTSETGPAEIRSLDGPHGKVQVPAVDAARVEAPLGRGPHGACLLGGSTGAAEKAGHKRVVLVELESEK